MAASIAFVLFIGALAYQTIRRFRRQKLLREAWASGVLFALSAVAGGLHLAHVHVPNIAVPAGIVFESLGRRLMLNP